MKKVIYTIIALIVVLLIVITMSLDGIVKHVIQKYGSQALGSQIEVGSVSLSLFSGSGSLKNVTVANPKGYKQPYAFKLKKVSFKINTGSLFSHTILIHNISVDAPTIVYIAGLGGSNINALLNNTKSAPSTPAQTTTTSASSSASSSSSTGKKVVIENVYINQAKVVGSLSGLASAAVTLGNIHLTNLGKNNGGISGAQATAQVLSAVIVGIGKSSFSAATGVVGDVGSRVGGAVEDVGKGVGNAIKSLFGSSKKSSN